MDHPKSFVLYSRRGALVLVAALACVVFMALLAKDSAVEETQFLAPGPPNSVELEAEGDLRAEELDSKINGKSFPNARVSGHSQLPIKSETKTGVCDPEAICGVVLNSGGQPLAGAECSLYSGEQAQGMQFSSGLRSIGSSPAATVLSDSDGVFELPAAEGYWTLQVEYEGLQQWREESIPDGSYRRILLEPRRAVLIRVSDEHGVPIEGVQLVLLADPYANRVGARAKSLTDTAGRAELEVQPGRSWYVGASHPSYRSTVFDVPAFNGSLWVEKEVVLLKGIRVFGTVTDPRAGDAPEGATVAISAWSSDRERTIPCNQSGQFDSGPVFGLGLELELTARAPGYAEVRRVLELGSDGIIKDGAYEIELALGDKEVRVVGQVITADEMAPGLADIFIKPIAGGNYIDALDLGSYAESWRPMATTDAAGKFQLEGLMAEHAYQLLVVPRAKYSGTRIRIPALEAGTVQDLGEITVGEGAKVFGVVRYENGTPAVHLPIAWIGLGSLTWKQMTDPEYFPASLDLRRDVYTNRDGRFEFTMIPGGATFHLYWGEEWRVGGDRDVGRFTVKAGEVVGPLEIIIPADELSGTASAAGAVLDPTGLPVDNVLIEVWDGPATEILGQGIEVSKLTGESGAFLLGPLQSGQEYRVTATDLRGRFEKLSTNVIWPENGGGLPLQLSPGPLPPVSLEGTVTDALGNPLSGIDLTLHLSPLFVRCACLARSTRTDDQGAFSFGLVIEGEHKVGVLDRQGRFPSKMVKASPGPGLLITME